MDYLFRGTIIASHYDYFVPFLFYRSFSKTNILIIYDQNRTDEDTIYNMINNTEEHLQFKIPREENNNINYLDLSINRNTSSMDLFIYRKPTHTDITIHFSSNHPDDHKLAAFKYYIHRMINMPFTEQEVKKKEQNNHNGSQ